MCTIAGIGSFRLFMISHGTSPAVAVAMLL